MGGLNSIRVGITLENVPRGTLIVEMRGGVSSFHHIQGQLINQPNANCNRYI